IDGQQGTQHRGANIAWRLLDGGVSVGRKLDVWRYLVADRKEAGRRLRDSTLLFGQPRGVVIDDRPAPSVAGDHHVRRDLPPGGRSVATDRVGTRRRFA